MTFHQSEETETRRTSMLRTALGGIISEALADPEVIEIMVNPDGRLWVEVHGKGRLEAKIKIAPSEAERVIRLVASHLGADILPTSPLVSAELPATGERFEGLLPPLALAPCFSIRKHARVLYRLADYVKAKTLTDMQARILSHAIRMKKNILVIGGTSSGKTTLTNALLLEAASTGDRIIILEDTRELRCPARDCVQLRTIRGQVTLADLVRSTLRLRPDRIIVGEVRGAEALDMLKAWNTGHPGGIATLHANSARGGLYRLEQLIQEAIPSVPRYLIADAVNLLVFIEGRGESRRVSTLASVCGLGPDGDYKLQDVTEVSDLTATIKTTPETTTEGSLL